MSLYIDGTQSGTLADVTDYDSEDLSNSLSLYSGRDSAASPGYWTGLLDDVRLYGRLLTDLEITTLAAT